MSKEIICHYHRISIIWYSLILCIIIVKVNLILQYVHIFQGNSSFKLNVNFLFIFIAKIYYIIYFVYEMHISHCKWIDTHVIKYL